MERPPRPGGLTGREVQVVLDIARGLTNRQIAAKLGVSARTVDAHVQNIGMILGAFLSSPAAVAQQTLPPTLVPGSLDVKVLADKKVARLPAGRPGLYWRVESFPNLAQAQAAAGPMGLAVESNGKAWLFTLGPKGGASAGGTKVAEAGPLVPVIASEYLLRINGAFGLPGAITIVHTHPGSEAFYVLAGEACLRTPQGVTRVPSGRTEAGPGGDTPIQISSCGATELRQLIMFVVDATRPFSAPRGVNRAASLAIGTWATTTAAALASSSNPINRALRPSSPLAYGGRRREKTPHPNGVQGRSRCAT